MICAPRRTIAIAIERHLSPNTPGHRERNIHTFRQIARVCFFFNFAIALDRDFHIVRALLCLRSSFVAGERQRPMDNDIHS